jgi:hypothetical protein
MAGIGMLPPEYLDKSEHCLLVAMPVAPPLGDRMTRDFRCMLPRKHESHGRE